MRPLVALLAFFLAMPSGFMALASLPPAVQRPFATEPEPIRDHDNNIKDYQGPRVYVHVFVLDRDSNVVNAGRLWWSESVARSYGFTRAQFRRWLMRQTIELDEGTPQAGVPTAERVWVPEHSRSF